MNERKSKNEECGKVCAIVEKRWNSKKYGMSKKVNIAVAKKLLAVTVRSLCNRKTINSQPSLNCCVIAA
jgi:hypothetical protein